MLTWLLTITRNVAIDAIRANRSTPTEGALIEEMISATMQVTSPEEDVLRHAERDAAVEQLRHYLPEQARAVVLAVVGNHRCRDQRLRGHSPGNGQDPYPHRTAPRA